VPVDDDRVARNRAGREGEQVGDLDVARRQVDQVEPGVDCGLTSPFVAGAVSVVALIVGAAATSILIVALPPL
jgi:hypothetical protein